MKKTKIDWCDSTWNPVTGCLHGCAYCYARRIAERFRAKEFSGAYTVNEYENVQRTTYELEEPMKRCCTDAKGLHVYEKAPYPFGFVPTFHRYRLDDPKHWTKPKNIFVCSMADLFGEWVPDEWYCCGVYDYSVWQKRFAEICAESIVPELEKMRRCDK